MVEPVLAGVVDNYVNLCPCYDVDGLQGVRAEIAGETAAYKLCYKRAYRCLTAAAQLLEDDRVLLDTPQLEAKLRKRAKGILSREVKKTGRQQGRARQRFLGAVTCQGEVTLFHTVEALCTRVYELSDTYGLGAGMLSELASGAMAAGYDVVLCPSPLFPDRLEHLLIPELSLAFVRGTHAAPWPGHPARRVRLDAMADPELLRRSKQRLKFSRKVAAALIDETVEALGEAKAHHDSLEALYHPYVDFGHVQAIGDALAEELLAL